MSVCSGRFGTQFQDELELACHAVSHDVVGMNVCECICHFHVSTPLDFISP